MLGGRLTEADIRLFTTIVRFDPVYVTHFKCNISTIRDGFPGIQRWMLNLYWNGPNSPAFKETTNFDSIKAHYFQSHPQVSVASTARAVVSASAHFHCAIQINPTRIVPDGPTPHISPLK